MYAHAPAPGDIADDGITRYRLATLRVPHHDAVDALDAHALAAANAVDEPLDDRRWLWWLGRLQFRMQQPKYCGDLHIALTDGRHQVRRVGESQRLGDLAQLFLGRLGDPPPAKLALEDLLSDSLRRLMLLALEHLANLVARAPRANVREPIARGFRCRRPDNLDRLRVPEGT